MFSLDRNHLAQLLQQAKNSTFLKNVGVLLTGSVIAQSIVVLLTPLYSRLFTPAQFGLFASITAFIGILGLNSNFRYSMGIVLPQEEQKAREMLILGGLTTSFIAILALFLLLIEHEWIAQLCFSADFNSLLLLYIPLGLLLISLEESLNFLMAREKRFTYMSNTQIVVATIKSATILSVGYAGWGLPGLLLGHFAGLLASVVRYATSCRKILSHILNGISLPSLRITAYEYRMFPFYSLPQNLLNSIAQNLPFFLLPLYYSVSETGQFYFAFSLLGLPITLSSQALRKVAYQKMAELLHTNGNIRPFLIKSTLLLFFSGIIPALLIFFFGPAIFAFFLGTQWEQAGVFARILIPWFFIGFLNVPAMVFFQAKLQQRFLLFYEAVLSTIRVATFFFGCLYLSIENTLVVYSVVGVLFNAFIIFKALVDSHIGQQALCEDTNL